MLVDIHAHLAHFSYNELKKLSASPLFPALVINSVHSENELEQGLKLAEKNIIFALSGGVHPQTAYITDRKTMEFIEMISVTPHLKGIGETGLDLFHTNPPLASQKKIFKIHLDIARQRNLPAIIHCRNGFEELFEIIQHYDIPLIIHGYSGGFKYLDTIIKNRFYISFGMPIVYPQSKKLRRIAEKIPSDRILTETDSPYNLFYKADPLINKNTPLNISKIISKLAEIKRFEKSEMEELLTGNLQTLGII